MSNDRHAELLAKSDRACLTAPAGCGKTEIIAKAVAYQVEGRQLILTHTHAGVNALRDRLKKLNVSPHYYYVDTIAGWSLKYAAAFPKVSGITDLLPTGNDWDQVYQAVSRLLSNSSIKEIIRCSYDGLYVDEYQDCVLFQHQIILQLANILPCRIVGDPLQGIFDFAGPLVDWSTHVNPNFTALPDLTIPWRWTRTNPGLGDWLVRLRSSLLAGESIDLQNGPLRWLQFNRQNRLAVCFNLARDADGSVVAIEKWPPGAHKLASTLNGTFTSMEEMECRDLLKWCEKIDKSSGPERAIAIIDFASECMTKVSTELRTIRGKLVSGDIRFGGLQKHRDIALTLIQVGSSQEICSIAAALKTIEGIKGTIVYRRELWNEMKKTLAEYESSRPSLKETAWKIRSRASSIGRAMERRMVSRTLLIKGLEFDHALVLDADQLNTKELYVAMTRGSQSLTVLSSNPVLKKDIPYT
jgi:hypothetical protein